MRWSEDKKIEDEVKELTEEVRNFLDNEVFDDDEVSFKETSR